MACVESQENAASFGTEVVVMSSVSRLCVLSIKYVRVCGGQSVCGIIRTTTIPLLHNSRSVPPSKLRQGSGESGLPCIWCCPPLCLSLTNLHVAWYFVHEGNMGVINAPHHAGWVVQRDLTSEPALPLDRIL